MLSSKSQCFSARDYDGVANTFNYPAPLYADGMLLRIGSYTHMEDVLSEYREKLACEGVSKMKRNILNFWPLNGNARLAFVENKYHAEDGEEIGASYARH